MQGTGHLGDRTSVEPTGAKVLFVNSVTPIDNQAMTRWLVKVKSKRGLALRDVLIVAKDESSARDRVQKMYLLSDITTICPAAIEFKTSRFALAKR